MDKKILESIKSAEDRKTETVVMEEWGGVTIVLKEPSAGDMARVFDKWGPKPPEKKGGKGKPSSPMLSFAILGVTMENTEGERVFDSPDQAIEVLSPKRTKSVTELMIKGNALSGVDENGDKVKN